MLSCKNKGNKLLVDLSESAEKKQVRFRSVQLYCLMPDNNLYFFLFSLFPFYFQSSVPHNNDYVWINMPSLSIRRLKSSDEGQARTSRMRIACDW